MSKDHTLSLLTYKYRNDHNAVDTYVRVLKYTLLKPKHPKRYKEKASKQTKQGIHANYENLGHFQQCHGTYWESILVLIYLCLRAEAQSMIFCVRLRTYN